MIKQLKDWISNKDNRGMLIAGIVSAVMAIAFFYLMFSIHY